MKKLFIGILAAVGGLVVVLLLSAFVMRQLAQREYTKKPLVLKLDFSRGLTEGQDETFFSIPLGQRKSSLFKVISAINTAAQDPRVRGIVMRLDHTEMGIAQCQEIRDAVMNFRGKGNREGKFAFAFADTFGEMSSGLIPYFLATAFDQIWLQPIGMLSITGLAAEMPFVREAIERWGVKAHVIRQGEFKSLFESLTEKDFSPENREAIQSILNTLVNLMIRDIAVSRELMETEVQEAIDHSPLLGKEAVKTGLIDYLGYWDQFLGAVQEAVGGQDILYVTPEMYVDVIAREDVKTGEPKFALITADGSIQRSPTPSLMDSSPVNARAIESAFREACRDHDVKAIILRLNSPGGSPVASETIRRSVAEAREKGKPVIVTMGDVGASGAYWIASAATKIVAHSSTITGSIGVISGKLVLDEFWEKLGIHWGILTEGQNADLWSYTVPYSEEGEEKVETLVRDLYDAFIEKVVTGRNLTEEHVREIARGRAWTGEDALRYGLVDQLGGYREAFILAQDATGLQGQNVPVIPYPAQKTFWEQIFALFGTNDQGFDAHVSVQQFARRVAMELSHMFAETFSSLTTHRPYVAIETTRYEWIARPQRR